MVALIDTLGLLHLAQERIHLFEAEITVRAHRAVASHGGQNFIALFFKKRAAAKLLNIR